LTILQKHPNTKATKPTKEKLALDFLDKSFVPRREWIADFPDNPGRAIFIRHCLKVITWARGVCEFKNYFNKQYNANIGLDWLKQGVCMAAPLVSEILEQVKALPDNLQHQVLSFARSLRTITQPGIPGKVYMQFTGSIPAEDVEKIRRAIETDCERVDPHEW
jgi:hypothetical protein